MKMIVYISGPPGCGKSTVVREFENEGYNTFGELLERFPREKLQDPRSFDTAKYIFEENVKRDKLLRKRKGVIIVDRHPIECLIIAKGLMKNDKEFEKIEEMYSNYKFLDGKIIVLTINSEISKKRYKSKKIELIKDDMIKDIYDSFENYSAYLKSDLNIDSGKKVNDIFNKIKMQLNKWERDKRFSYKRILIFGRAGTGKNWLGKRLSKKVGINFYDTDDMAWKKRFTFKRSWKEKSEILKKTAKKDKWIIVSGATSYVGPAEKRADLIIILKSNFIRSTYRIIKRHIKNTKSDKEKSQQNVFGIAYSNFKSPLFKDKLEEHFKVLKLKYPKKVKVFSQKEKHQFLRNIDDNNL